MSAPLPIPVWPWPMTDARLAILKAAKASLGTDIKIVPVEAIYGSPGRVLCFGETPSWLCSYAPIRAENVDNVASVAAALKFCIEAVWDKRWTGQDLLSEWMGMPVRQVGTEAYAGVAFG